MGFYETHVFNALMDRTLDSRAMHDERRSVLEPAHGAILELGVGTGLNLPFYPRAVDRITALAPDTRIDRRAHRRASARGLVVDYTSGDAASLPFDAASFDTVVATLVFCTIPDPARAAREVVRVLKPSGMLLFFEHVVRPKGFFRAFQHVFDPFNRRLGCGCSLIRDTRATLADAGFSDLDVEERTTAAMPAPFAWVIRGVARR
jgi:ubiquinone/menaquinone biosynthesis C-methylase UbiE